MVKSNENYDYLSLPGVTILQGEVHTCKACEEKTYDFPRIEQLNWTLARELIYNPSRLIGDEIRFLRKYLDWLSPGLKKTMNGSQRYM